MTLPPVPPALCVPFRQRMLAFGALSNALDAMQGLGKGLAPLAGLESATVARLESAPAASAPRKATARPLAAPAAAAIAAADGTQARSLQRQSWRLESILLACSCASRQATTFRDCLAVCGRCSVCQHLCASHSTSTCSHSAVGQLVGAPAVDCAKKLGRSVPELTRDCRRHDAFMSASQVNNVGQKSFMCSAQHLRPEVSYPSR